MWQGRGSRGDPQVQLFLVFSIWLVDFGTIPEKFNKNMLSSKIQGTFTYSNILQIMKYCKFFVIFFFEETTETHNLRHKMTSEIDCCQMTLC